MTAPAQRIFEGARITGGEAIVVAERRIELRTTCEARVFQYCHAGRYPGVGILRDLSSRGLGIELKRYVRPGGNLLLTLPRDNAPAIEFKGCAVWCRPQKNFEAFDVGVRIYEDVADVESHVAELKQLLVGGSR